MNGSGLVLPTFAEGAKYLLLTTSAVLVLKESTVFDQILTVETRNRRSTLDDGWRQLHERRRRAL